MSASIIDIPINFFLYLFIKNPRYVVHPVFLPFQPFQLFFCSLLITIIRNHTKIAEEEMYDGLYAVCTNLLDDDVADILKVSEGRWQIEDCFRTMKTDFEARPVYLNREDRIKAHFLTCFLALLHFRLLNRSLKGTYTTEQLLHTLKDIKFADIEEQGFMPVYERQEITDDLHETCGFRTDYQFITKRKMKRIQKKSKWR